MVFSSMIFLWIFLPFVFCVNLFAKTKISNYILLISSLFFYAWGEIEYLFLLIISIFANWLFAKALCEIKERKVVLAIGIIFNLFFLCQYKYLAFFVRMINDIFQVKVLNEVDSYLPIGISFYTFQAISFLVDIYRKDVDKQPTFINTALYIAFFPQLIAGPIVKYKDINQQIDSRQISSEKFAVGFRRFIYGLGKKVIISNVLGMCVDNAYANDVLLMDSRMIWIASLSYTMQIYYDFSGYSDMAIGLGGMFGFDIPENFNYPYLSKSIREFWRKWHISLSTWFKEYVYIPLGGNRKGHIRTYINLVIVFFLTGLWHGANYSYIVWGLYHGLFSIVERRGLNKYLERHNFISWLYCFCVVNIGWVLFRVEDVSLGFQMIKRMLLFWKYNDVHIGINNYIDIKVYVMLLFGILGMGIIQRYTPKRIVDKWKNSILETVYCMLVLILCLASLAANTYNPFIYFQF
ncbi:MAG: MBOAT family protein [Lachnospiraceae bacterium]|nr:MBOAT family protein [Lachnospiraceae bacterium]